MKLTSPVCGRSRGSLGILASTFVCSQCSEIEVNLDVILKEKSRLDPASTGGVIKREGQKIMSLYKGRLYPDAATPQVHPAIPNPLAEDYKEGCAILTKSPKSSAVLARRCVQGAIRDFCGIAKATLAQEINELEMRFRNGTLGDAAPYVSRDLIEAIDNIRSIGNIGAHMEKNVNKVVPIERDEAKLLLDLVGTLFSDWYQARSERQARLGALKKLVAAKKAAKKGTP